MARRKCYGKIPSSHPGLHNTIPSGKDTGKPARSSDLSRGQSKECYPGMRHRDCSQNHTKPTQRHAGQHSDYSNCSIHTLHTAEILQPANGGCEEEARPCMAWHAQQETASCATIPTDTGRRGHSASTTSFAAVRVQYKQGQTAKER